MNVSASNGYYFPLVPAYAAKAGAAARATTAREALMAEPVEAVAPTASATRESRGGDRPAAFSVLQAEAYRGRLADDPTQNSRARRALAEYVGVEDQPRREELRALGVDVYA
jgi:hypothetical protein